jgi:hypothetical protein
VKRDAEKESSAVMDGLMTGSRQDCMAVPFFLDQDRRMEVEAHSQMLGDGVRLICAAGAISPDVELLKRDYVGLARSDDRGHAPRARTTVRADASMHVIGHDAQHCGSFWSIIRLRAGLRCTHSAGQPRSWRYFLIPGSEFGDAARTRHANI